MTPQTRWIKDAPSDEAKRNRSMVVGWQNSLYAVNQLIKNYNSITLTPQPKADPHAPMQVIAARRQVLASLLELKNRLDEWVAALNRAGYECESIKAVRKAHRTLLDRAESWRAIRNLTFHYGDVMESPDDLLDTYDAIARITDTQMNSVWEAMIAVGRAAKDTALNHT